VKRLLRSIFTVIIYASLGVYALHLSSLFLEDAALTVVIVATEYYY